MRVIIWHVIYNHSSPVHSLFSVKVSNNTVISTFYNPVCTFCKVSHYFFKLESTVFCNKINKKLIMNLQKATK